MSPKGRRDRSLQASPSHTDDRSKKRKRGDATVYDAVAGSSPLNPHVIEDSLTSLRPLLDPALHPSEALHLPHPRCSHLQHSTYPSRRSPLPPSRRTRARYPRRLLLGRSTSGRKAELTGLRSTQGCACIRSGLLPRDGGNGGSKFL
jgi:hypothetical protein